MTDTTPNTGFQFRTDVEEDYGPVTDWATDFDLMDPDYVVHPEQRWTEQRNGGCPIAFTERRQRTWLPVRYEDLSAILKVHLRREVTEVMPVADRVMTEKEMDGLGQHSIEQFDKKFLVTYLGMVLATNPPADRKELFKEIPPPVRLGYRLIGRRMFRKQYSTLFPGRPVPETL